MLLQSLRLSALHSHYAHHEHVWDIGCDHGKLGLSFLEYEEVKAIHLVDPSLPVIEKLRHFIDSYITGPSFKIRIEHKTGQEVVPGPEKKIVFIAGMGGKEILSILRHLINFMGPADDVVISPHRDILPLRKALGDSRFFLGKESLVWEEGRCYQILSLNTREQKKVHPYGEEIFRDEKYLTHQIATFSAHQDVQSQAYVTYMKGLTQRFR